MMKRIFLIITFIFFAVVLFFTLQQKVRGEEEIFKEMPPELPRYRVHIIRRGEDLHLLSAYYYNNARLWRLIYEANKEVIKNPNLIYPEVRLLIPELPGE